MKKLWSFRAMRLRIMGSLLAVVALLLLATGASAHVTSARAASVIPYAGAPITTIVHTSQGPAFQPVSMQIFLAHTSSIEVVNSTNHAQTLLNVRGIVVMQLAPHASKFLTYTATGTYDYHLQNHSQATFTAIVS